MRPGWGGPQEREVDALEADLREQDCLQSGAAETLSWNWANPSSPHSTSKKVCALEGLMESH